MGRMEGLLRGFDGAYGNRVVFLCADDGGFGTRLLVESGESGLVAGLQRVDLITHNQGVFRALRNATTGASRSVTWHGMFRSAHGVANSSRKRLAGGESGRNGHSHNHHHIQEQKSD